MITAAQLWGIVIPGWIGAVSGLVGSAVALASLLIARASDQRAKDATTRAERAENSERATRSALAETVRTLIAEPGAGPDAPHLRAPESAARRQDALQRVLARLEDPPAGPAAS
jgi:hypothetical protein